MRIHWSTQSVLTECFSPLLRLELIRFLQLSGLLSSIILDSCIYRIHGMSRMWQLSLATTKQWGWEWEWRVVWIVVLICMRYNSSHSVHFHSFLFKSILLVIFPLWYCGCGFVRDQSLTDFSSAIEWCPFQHYQLSHLWSSIDWISSDNKHNDSDCWIQTSEEYCHDHLHRLSRLVVVCCP